MRQRRARGVTLVHDREDRSADVSRAALPGLCHEGQRFVVELAQGSPVLVSVDDDLLPLECWVQVRNDAHRPAGRPVAEPQRLRRGLVLVARAERAARELVLDFVRRAGPGGPRRGDGYPATGDRITTKIRHPAWAI